MATQVTGRPGVFRRLLGTMSTWSGALSYSGFEYTLDRLALVERELAEIKKRLSQYERSRSSPENAQPTSESAD